MTASRKLWLVVPLCLLVLAPAALAGPPRITSIDYPGAALTVAFGINPAGDIVGGYSMDGSDEHGFLRHNGTFSSYDYPGAAWTEFEAITPQGDILGEYGLADNTVHGFILRDGTPYPVDVPGQPTDQGLANTMPVHISPEGTIVGCYHQSLPSGDVIMDTMYGYVMQPDGSVTSFDMGRSMHNGVNAAGDIVGIYYDEANVVSKSYLIHNGQVSWFSFPDSVMTQAWDISPTGAIAGFHRTDDGTIHGFVLANGEWTSFDVPGSTLTKAFGVNAGGDIVGYYYDENGVHGFLRSRQGR